MAGGGAAAAIRLGSGPGPGGARPRTGPTLSARAKAERLLIARLARAMAPRRPLPARPSSGEPQRRTKTSLNSATVHRWPITGLDFLTCKLGTRFLALYGEYHIKLLLAARLSLGKTPSHLGEFTPS